MIDLATDSMMDSAKALALEMGFAMAMAMTLTLRRAL
jgi:hypothetical protein